MQKKVCPLVIRQIDPTQPSLQDEILLFKHPNHSIQLVKGSLEKNEDIVHACQRELWEESGLKVAVSDFKFLADFKFSLDVQYWHVYFCYVTEARTTWSWQTIDDHGHRFRFFWCPLAEFKEKSEHWRIGIRYVEVIDTLIEYYEQHH